MATDYKVLYRKYRPTSFDEVIGQKYTISMLKNAIINDKISHAYIFTGPRGTGKTSSAKIFAKTINCENAREGVPCGKCSSCLNVDNNADIIEIDAASNTGVDEIRELINNIKIAPSFSKYKVYIIDEVHMLTQNAFNALLLTLEEPPSHIVFILATTNIESVPITILSRCQRYDFKKIDNEELEKHLKDVCDKENISITEDAIQEIVYLCEGGCRDALSILNQLSTSHSSIDLDTVLSNYGSVSLVQIKEIVTAYLDDDYNHLQEIFQKLEKSSIDYKVFIKKLIDELFNKAILYKQENNIVVYENIKNIVFELNDLINKININIDPFLLIFMILIQYINVSQGTLKEPIAKEEIQENNNIKKTKNIEITGDIVAIKKNTEIKEEKKSTNVVSALETPKIDKDFEDYIEKLKEVRINNCFAEADKALLNSFKEKWLKFNDFVDVGDVIKPVVIDSMVVLASRALNIITNVQNSMVELFNHELTKIEKQYADALGEEIHFIALSTTDWDAYKKDYIKKLKENYVYQIMEEPTYQQETKEVNQEETSEDYTDVFAIFDKDKIEIK